MADPAHILAHFRKLAGPEPPDSFISDGCTHAPDLHLREACRWHDWHYRLGGTRLDRQIADDFFWLNLRQLGASATIAFAYWLAVRLFGGPRFRRSR